MIFDSSTAIEWGLDLGKMFKTMFDALGEIFQRAFIGLASLVYNVVNIVYQVFLTLANTNIFTESDYKMLSNRVYVILGVVMLFVIAYNFLLLVIDPDKNKGGQSVEKMLKSIVTTFIMIVLMPSIFAFAYQIQAAILQENHIIERFFANATSSNPSDSTNLDIGEGNTIADGGKQMAVSTFTGFFFAMDNADINNAPAYDQVWNLSYEDNWYYSDKDSGLSIDCTGYQTCNLSSVLEYVTTTGEFGPLYAFANNIRYGFELSKDGGGTAPEEPNKTATMKLSYNWLLAIIAGAYLVYVIISFCFDLGVRVVKLAFYQMIAPLTISCRILPNKESVYTNWQKQTITTFVSVFIRVFIMQLGVYLINVFTSNLQRGGLFPDANIFVRSFATAFIVLGIVTFIKTASKLICDIFGLEDIGGLGLKEKFASGGGFALGAGLGAMVTGGVRNAVSAHKAGKGFWKGAASTIAGAGSGLARGMYQGRNAQSWSQMMSSAGTAAEATTTAREDRRDRAADREANNQNIFAAGLAAAGAGLAEWATAGDRTQEQVMKAAAERKKAFDEMEAQAQKVLDKLQTNRDFYSALFEVHQAQGYDLFSKLSETQAIDKDGNAIIGSSDKEKATDYYETHKGWAMQDYEARLDALKNGTASVNVDKKDFLTYDEEKIRAAAESQIDRQQFLQTDMVAYQAAQEAAASTITLEQCGGDLKAYAEARDAAKASVKIEGFQQLDSAAYEKKVSEVIANMDLSSFATGIDESAYANAVQAAATEEIRTLTNVMGNLQKAAVENLSSFANGDFKIPDSNGNLASVANGKSIQDVMSDAIGKLDITDVKTAAQKAVIVAAQSITQPVTEQIEVIVTDKNGQPVYDENGVAKTRFEDDPNGKTVRVKEGGTVKSAKDADKIQTLRDKREGMKTAAEKARRDAHRARRSSDKK